jgi:hypothetical protein
MQDAITPSTQTLRNVASLLLHLAIPVVGFVYFRWYITLGALLLTFIIGSLFGAFMPQPQSMFFFGHIQRSLADRRAQYVTSNDELRVEAVDELLARLKKHLADTVAETQNRDRS